MRGGVARGVMLQGAPAHRIPILPLQGAFPPRSALVSPSVTRRVAPPVWHPDTPTPPTLIRAMAGAMAVSSRSRRSRSVANPAVPPTSSAFAYSSRRASTSQRDMASLMSVCSATGGVALPAGRQSPYPLSRPGSNSDSGMANRCAPIWISCKHCRGKEEFGRDCAVPGEQQGPARPRGERAARRPPQRVRRVCVCARGPAHADPLPPSSPTSSSLAWPSGSS